MMFCVRYFYVKYVQYSYSMEVAAIYYDCSFSVINANIIFLFYAMYTYIIHLHVGLQRLYLLKDECFLLLFECMFWLKVILTDLMCMNVDGLITNCNLKENLYYYHASFEDSFSLFRYT